MRDTPRCPTSHKAMKTRSAILPSTLYTSTMAGLDYHPIPQLLIVPETAGENASIITLAHPRTLSPSRYFFCPAVGIYEFMRIKSPQSMFRSCLLAPPRPDVNYGSSKGEIQEKMSASTTQITDSIETGYVTKTAELFTATPMDPLFLLLPALTPKPSNSRSSESKALFLSSDDLFENLVTSSKHFSLLLDHLPTRQVLERRMDAVCDIVEAGDEKMYRLSHEKLLAELVTKARKIVSVGLPTSMEERFIKNALEVPLMSVKREASTTENNLNQEADEELPATPSTLETLESQSSTTSTMTTDSQTSVDTSITIPNLVSHLPISPALFELLRLRTALSFMLSSYVASHLASTLTNIMTLSESPIDFEPLDNHLSHVAKMRAEALAARSLSDFSRKRGIDDDEEMAECRAEKKRKKEEEERRKKAGESRGVRDLRKVDISGMKKMSDFFGKKAVAKKKS